MFHNWQHPQNYINHSVVRELSHAIEILVLVFYTVQKYGKLMVQLDRFQDHLVAYNP